jgi:hypothetical protein
MKNKTTNSKMKLENHDDQGIDFTAPDFTAPVSIPQNTSPPKSFREIYFGESSPVGIIAKLKMMWSCFYYGNPTGSVNNNRKE